MVGGINVVTMTKSGLNPQRFIEIDIGGAIDLHVFFRISQPTGVDIRQCDEL